MASKLCPYAQALTKSFSGPGLVLGRRRDPPPLPGSGAARPLPADSRVAERWPAARGSPGSPAAAALADLNVASRGGGTRQMPGRRGPGCTARSLSACCPLDSPEPASPCFPSLRRCRLRVSPRGGQGSERAGSMCPAACGGCHLPAPQCGRRGPGAAVPTAPCTAVTQRARFRLKPRLLPAQAFAPACGASSPPASPAPLCQGSPS